MPEQLPLHFTTAPSYAAADYLVSGANRAAHDLVMNPDAWNSYGLRLCGPRGSGRTHLVHVWAERFNATFVISPITEVSTNMVVDDVLSFANEKALFHTLNLAQAANKKIVLVMEQTPLTEQFQLPDVLSRLNALPQAKLGLPDDALMAALLHKHFADRQLHVADEVVHYLVPRMERSFAAAATITKTLDEQSLKDKKPLSVAFVRAALANGSAWP